MLLLLLMVRTCPTQASLFALPLHANPCALCMYLGTMVITHTHVLLPPDPTSCKACQLGSVC